MSSVRITTTLGLAIAEVAGVDDATTALSSSPKATTPDERRIVSVAPPRRRI
jgi:hypothetical protein